MKPYRICAIIIALILIGSAAANFIQRSPHGISGQTDLNDFKLVFPNADGFRRAKTDIALYEALGKNQELLGYVFRTADLAPGIKGHGGPIQMLVAIDHSGKILDLKITESRETPAYTAKLPEFLSRIIGTSTLEPLELGKNIDGISRATITSSAIVTMLNKSAQKIHSNVALQPPKRPLPNFKKPIAGIVIFLIAIFAWISRNQIWRWVALSGSFILLGVIFKEMLSTAHISGITLGQIPSWIQNPLFYVLLIGAIICSILWGRVFCAGVCPFAFVQEGMDWLKRKIVKTTFSPTEKTDRACRWIKYLILIGLLIACFILKQSGLATEEVYITLFTAQGSLAAWMLLIAVIFASFFFLRFWCRYLCPFGAFLALISQFRIIKKHCIPQPSKALCADAAECLYCDRCLQTDLSKSTKKQDIVFLVFILISIIIFTINFSQSIQPQHLKESSPAEKNLVASTPAPYIDIEKIKKAGLAPRPAKYWKVVNDE